MAKALGLIGNFKGKLGNTVGYSLKDSNNKQTQGVRVYQPVVRNPKTAAQAEQRAKLAPINATYRALKMVIDRGQEGKAYGNKSRLAWLSGALKGYVDPWFIKGASINMPALVPLTKGSLSFSVGIDHAESYIQITATGATAAGTTTLGALSSAILASYPQMKEGDQMTFVHLSNGGSNIVAHLESIVLDKTSTAAIPSFLTVGNDIVSAFASQTAATAGAVILSREGDNGAHLRSTTSLIAMSAFDVNTTTAEAKQAAIESYMSQGANTDWAEESLM